MGVGQRVQWRDQQHGILVLAAALLLVLAGVLLDRFVVQSAGVASGLAALLNEAILSFISIMPVAWATGIALLCATGCLWGVFRSIDTPPPHRPAVGRNPFGAHSAAMAPGHNHSPTGAFQRAGHLLDALQQSVGQRQEQIRAWEEQAQLLADSMTACLTNAQQAMAAGRQAGNAATQGAAALERVLAGLQGSVEQMQQATGRMGRLKTQSQQAEALLAAFRERGEALRLQMAEWRGAGGDVHLLWEAYRKDLKQLAILTRTMDMDARDSHLLLDRTLQEVQEAVQLTQRSVQAVAEIGRASIALAEEVGVLRQVTQVHAETAGRHAEQSAALAAGSLQERLQVAELAQCWR